MEKNDEFSIDRAYMTIPVFGFYLNKVSKIPGALGQVWIFWKIEQFSICGIVYDDDHDASLNAGWMLVILPSFESRLFWLLLLALEQVPPRLKLMENNKWLLGSLV